MSTKRNLAIGGAVAAVVVVGVVLGCVFGLAGQGGESCVQKEDNRTKGLLITGGEGWLPFLSNGGANPGVEAELYIPEENKFCKLPNLPETRFAHTMEVVDGKPVICGGLNGRKVDTSRGHAWLDRATPGFTCMQFSPLSSEGKWKTDYAKLRCERSRHTSWVNCDGKMVQLGGGYKEKYGYGNCVTGETVNGSVMWRMRQAKRDACLIDIGESVIITGGRNNYGVGLYDSEDVVEKYNKNIYLYSTDYFLTKEKEALPKLQAGRWKHGCGSFKDKDGNTVLVVAGGRGLNNMKAYEHEKTTEIFKLGDTEWKSAAALPYRLHSMASISWTTTNSVLFIGGHEESEPTKAEILSFDGETWKEIAKMSSGRSSSAVTQVVADDYKEFCN